MRIKVGNMEDQQAFKRLDIKENESELNLCKNVAFFWHFYSIERKTDWLLIELHLNSLNAIEEINKL